VDAQIAQAILIAITAVAAVVWLAGLQFLIASARTMQPPPPEHFTLAESPPPSLIVGGAEVEGDPAKLAAKAASVLALGSVGGLGQLRIIEGTEERVVFKGTPADPSRPSAGQQLRRGVLRFTVTRGNRTQIDYAIEVRGGRGLLWGGAIFQVLGLVARVTGFWLIWSYVVPNPIPAVRGQAFQMLQVGHFLWPPFLFGGLYRKRYGVLRASFDTFVHNLPYFRDG
jgi:hypothetical protein